MIDKIERQSSVSAEQGKSRVDNDKDFILKAVKFGARRAAESVVEGISFDLRIGECLGVIGPNASGKSSFLQAIRGLLKRHGQLQIQGKEANEYSRRELAHKIATVPQKCQYTFPFSVQEMVLLGRSPHMSSWANYSASDMDLCNEILNAMSIGHLAARKMNQLSGGEERKVCVARALMQQTPILLLDEPNAALDPKAQVEMFELLANLRSKFKITLLVVLHDLNFVKRLCDKVLALQEGRQIFWGNTSDFLSNENLTKLYSTQWSEFSHDQLPSLFYPRLESENDESGS